MMSWVTGAPSKERETAHRPVGVGDGIELTVPANAYYSEEGQVKAGLVEFSPDGSRFIIVLKRGEISSNTNRYSMLLWRISEIKQGKLGPRTVLEMRSSSNLEAIHRTKWSDDNETVWFLGESPGESQQIYEINTTTGELERITHHSTNVVGYSRDQSGGRIAYVAERPAEDLWNDETRRTGIVAGDLPNLKLADFILGRKGTGNLVGRGEATATDLFVQDRSGIGSPKLQRSLPQACQDSGGDSIAISPNGVYIAVRTDVPVADIPPDWNEYEDPGLRLTLSSIGRGDGLQKGFGLPEWSNVHSFEILDIRTGRTWIPLNAPISELPESHTSPVWATDSGSVILSGVFLPLDVADLRQNKAPTQRPVTVEVKPDSREVNVIGDGCRYAVRWDALTNDLICVAKSDGEARSNRLVHFRRSNNRWYEVKTASTSPSQLDVVVREDMNTPPRLYVRDADRGHESLLLDLNPRLNEIHLGRVEEVKWEWARGHYINAGLYYPPDYHTGRRYPLVIQGHGWTRDRFWIEGYSTTGYAAQALAAREMLVLQLNDMLTFPDTNDGDTALHEMRNAMDIYRTAIQFLDHRGVVDSRRVGLSGWSHTCDYLMWALTHETSLFAAAACSGESAGGYLSFMSRLGGGNSDVDSLYGGPPLGTHLQTWVTMSPSFNLDRVHAPLRLYVLSAPLYLPAEWESFEGLTLLHKPVDMVILESAQHVLIRPAERLVVSGGNVDWFDFWLNNHEDRDPEKVEQYRRWRNLRKLQAPSETARTESRSHGSRR